MIISYIWLKELINHRLSPKKLAETLTGLGLETCITDDRRGAYKNFRVGKVNSIKPHPDADNLNIAQVDAGGGKLLSIVCAAPNIAEGQTVPVALANAKLPDGSVIKKRKIRNEVSEGMICGEAELGLGEETAGIMVLDDSFEAGKPLSECFELEDVMLEADLTPNRGDCLGLIGIAREVAAATGGEIIWPDTGGIEDSAPLKNFEVLIKNDSESPRYSAREISGVTVAPSPVKIRRRLADAGIKPINNLVDATNYVMIETGHPLHVFDRRMLKGAKIISRNALKGEKFITLDGREHTLEDWMPVIADAGKAVALAGVMGGKNSEVRDDTTEIVLEAAYFDPVAIRKTAGKLGISSESSHRFERGVNPEGIVYASLRAAALITKLAGGKLLGFTDVYPKKLEFPQIRLRTQKVNKTLGLELTDKRTADCLSRLGFDFKKEGKGSFSVACPPHRHDLSQEVDLVEEVARLIGYKNIPSTVARTAQYESSRKNFYKRRAELNSLWIAAGFTETVNYSFINPDWRENLKINGAKHAVLANPISADWSELRGSLLPGLLKTAAFNLRRGEERISIFETGVVFRRDEKGGVIEEFFSSGVMTGGEEEIFGIKIPRDFRRLKGILTKVIKSLTGKVPKMVRPADPKPFLYPHRQVEITPGGNSSGFLGQLHPLATEAFDIDCELYCFEISVDRLLQSDRETVKVRRLPKFPGIKRDIALIVDENVEAGGIVNTILETDTKRIKACRLFDLYRGEQVPEGSKSLAFNLYFLDEEKTLTDAAGDEIIGNILASLREKHDARLR